MTTLYRIRVISENLITDKRLAATEKWLDRWIDRFSKAGIVLGLALVLFILARLFIRS